MDAQDEGRGLQVTSRRADGALAWGEVAIYFLTALILLAGAAILVGDAVTTFIDQMADGEPVQAAAAEVLSILLLVFVFVELLGAVRKTLRERRLLAEPFLLVGIIASIKEIVVVAGAERPKDEGFEAFRNGMVEIGVLAGVILILAVSAFLLRARQEKPPEEDGTP
ncbi:MAG TPA: phosphate-starvation-inducible PsiE family protein [Acidimicrobiales bacterium]|nr:phosphate-starvation-inducible PsiE family protein [Acidimicrobiales bacterium]